MANEEGCNEGFVDHVVVDDVDNAVDDKVIDGLMVVESPSDSVVISISISLSLTLEFDLNPSSNVNSRSAVASGRLAMNTKKPGGW